MVQYPITICVPVFSEVFLETTKLFSFLCVYWLVLTRSSTHIATVASNHFLPFGVARVTTPAALYLYIFFVTILIMFLVKIYTFVQFSKLIYNSTV